MQPCGLGLGRYRECVLELIYMDFIAYSKDSNENNKFSVLLDQEVFWDGVSSVPLVSPKKVGV
jgi:hypothetical protein